MTGRRAVLAAALAILTTGPVAAHEEDVAEAVHEYMAFATYVSGIITPAQIDKSVYEASTIVDTRSAGEFAAGHLPGAVNIDWREVPKRLDELPTSGLVILYCYTGALSSQAAFAARLLGRDNVVSMQTGYVGWQDTAAYKP